MVGGEGVLLRLVREIVSSLSGDELRAYLVFLKEVSIGDILALELLRGAGVGNPKAIVEKLVRGGWLERGYGCVSLSRDVREALASTGLDVVVAGRKLAKMVSRVVGG